MAICVCSMINRRVLTKIFVVQRKFSAENTINLLMLVTYKITEDDQALFSFGRIQVLFVMLSQLLLQGNQEGWSPKKCLHCVWCHHPCAFGDRLTGLLQPGCVRCHQAWEEAGFCKENLTALLILFEVNLSKHWESKKEMKGEGENESFNSRISFTICFIKRC